MSNRMPDLALAADELTAGIVEILEGFAEGVAADLQHYGARISENLVVAAAVPMSPERREALFESLETQAVLLADIHRVRISGEGWKLLRKALRMAFRLLAVVLAGGVV